jgi:hypothetical protein
LTLQDVHRVFHGHATRHRDVVDPDQSVPRLQHIPVVVGLAVFFDRMDVVAVTFVVLRAAENSE